MPGCLKILLHRVSAPDQRGTVLLHLASHAKLLAPNKDGLGQQPPSIELKPLGSTDPCFQPSLGVRLERIVFFSTRHATQLTPLSILLLYHRVKWRAFCGRPPLGGLEGASDRVSRSVATAANERGPSRRPSK